MLIPVNTVLRGITMVLNAAFLEKIVNKRRGAYLRAALIRVLTVIGNLKVYYI